MSASSRGSVDTVSGPRKKILSEEVNKQLLQITSQIDALRSDVQSNQESIRLLSGSLQRSNSLKRRESFTKNVDEPMGGVVDNTLMTRKDDNMNPIFIGDIISLRLSDDGYVFGDIRMNNMGVEHLEPGQMRSGSSSPNDAAFRICPKLNYRTKREVRSSAKKGDDEDLDKISEIRQHERLQHENEQNQLLLNKVRSQGGLVQVYYGDIIQLEHVRSGRFVGMRKSHSLRNHNNQAVVLMNAEEEGQNCYFKVMPRFKVRGLGSSMYSGDEVIFESIFDSVVLSANKDYCFNRALPMPNLRVPLVIRTPKTYEVNGCFKPIALDHAQEGSSSTVDNNVTSFSVQLFARFKEHDAEFLSCFNFFRLFHLDFHGFLSASCFHDKGEVMASLNEAESLNLREGNIAPHIPYLRGLNTPEPNHPINLNAKGVWSFECMDQFKCELVAYNTPIRIKHVATNKYLAVDSSEYALYKDPTHDTDDSRFYNCFLVNGEDPKCWNVLKYKDLSNNALAFRVVPTGKEGAYVRNGSTTIKIEHVTEDGRRLVFADISDLKPRFLNKQKKTEPMQHILSRVGFIEKTSGVEVFSLKPLGTAECALLSRVSSYIPFIKLYTNRYLAAQTEAEFPIDMCEQLVNSLLDLVDDLGKGDAPPRRFENVADYCSEANSLKEKEFSQLFGGEVASEVQYLCAQTKLLDALFEAAVAPYNQCFFRTPDGPFDSPVTSQLPAAVQKYLYVCIQRILTNNPDCMEYFSSRYIRTWRSPKKREREPWRNILVDQCEDGFGATVLLALLFKSSSRILHKIVNDELLERFRMLIKKCGPHPRLISLFASTCWVEGRPVQSFQEACVRKLWMREEDRYSIGATFHESSVQALTEALQPPFFYPYKEVMRCDGTVSGLHLRHETESSKVPEFFLGKSDSDRWNPVVVVWRSSHSIRWGDTHGQEDRGGLYFSPQELGMPTVGQHIGSDNTVIGEYVPVEHLLWVLEPGRLSEAVTGQPFKPFSQSKETLGQSGGLSNSIDSKSAKAERKLRSELYAQRRKQEELFLRNRNLANYITDQINLLTQTCRGRCYNSIHQFEKSFSYDMLLNMASNPWLPYRFRAAVVQFILCLYVDRFPQSPQCGAPHLPEQLWIYEDEKVDFFSRKSTIPVVDEKLRITDEEAIPEFYVPTLSSAHGRSNELISMPHASKFFLLNSLCMSNLGVDNGRVTFMLDDDHEGLNVFCAALLNAQHNLLKFGFQSRIEVLRVISKASAQILDGRDDYETKGQFFDPPEHRYKEMGRFSDAIVGIKKAIVDQMFDLFDLQVNYRLARLFGKFKEKMKQGADIDKWVHSVDMFYEFEGLFNVNTKKKYQDDSAHMDLALICGKEDFEEALVDILLYEDSKLMAASLHLLDACYGQRRTLVRCLDESLLLEGPTIAVYGEIHSLRSDITELFELIKTHSVWGVHSPLAGDFDDTKFGRAMHMIDTLLEFLFTDKIRDDAPTDSSTSDFEYVGAIEMKTTRGSSIDRAPLNPTPKKKPAPKKKKNSKDGKSRIASTSHLPPGCRYQSVLVKILLDHFETNMPHIPTDMRVSTLFKELDSSRDGKLSKEEVFDGVRRILKVPVTELNDEELDSIFDKMKDTTEDFVNFVSFEGFIEGGGSNMNYNGQFLDCEKGLDGRIYSCERIWSTDVAAKWIKKARGEDGGPPLSPSAYHQRILRSCNLQMVLSAAIAMEADIAFTGSRCTIGLKVESQRRLTMVKSAALVLAKYFVMEDPENQEAMFRELRHIQKLATPDEIKKDKDDAGFDERLNGSVVVKPIHYKCVVNIDDKGMPQPVYDASRVVKGAGEGFPIRVQESWPGTIREMCQDLIMAVFKGNEKLSLYLAEGVNTDPLLDLFAYVANQAYKAPNMHVDTAPILDFFFHLCMPSNERTLQEFQLYTAKMLMTGFEGLLDAASSCITRIGERLSGWDGVSGDNQNPYRIARLLRAVMAHGNDRTAIFVSNGTKGIDFTGVCDVITKHIKQSENGSIVYLEGQELVSEFSPRGDVKRFMLSSRKNATLPTVPAKPLPPHINRETYDLDGLKCGDVSDLLALLVDLADLLPLSEEEVRSTILWEFIRRVCVPCIDHIANLGRELMDGERFVNASVIDFVDSVLTKIDNHGLLEAMMAEQYRVGENMIEDMRDDVQAMSKNPVYSDSLSPRTLSAIGRIIARCEGNSSGIEGKSSQEVHVYPDRAFTGARASIEDALKSRTRESMSTASGSMVFHHQVGIFRNGIADNTHIQKAIQRRRFELLTKLEKGVPADKKKYPGAADVKWEDLVRRMAIFALDRSRSLTKDTDPNDHDGVETCAIIFRLLKDHLIKARTWPLNEFGERVKDANGNKSFNDPSVVDLELFQPEDLERAENEAYVQRQLNLLHNGVVQLLLDVIMMRNTNDEDGDLSDMSLEVLDEVQLGGNMQVRKVLYDYIVEKDNDGRFLNCLSRRLERSMDSIVEAKNFGILGHCGETITLEMYNVLADTAQTITFMINLCVGHHAQFQELLREQPMYTGRTFDLVGMAIDMLCEMAESQQVVEELGKEEIILVRLLLEFLIVIMMGPRPGNQLKVALSDVAIALNSIVPARSKVEKELEAKDPSFVTMQDLCFKVLSACLEARTDTECHKPLRTNVDMRLLCKCAVGMDCEARTIIDIAASENRLLNAEEESRVHIIQESLTQIWILHHELFPELPQKVTMEKLMGTDGAYFASKIKTLMDKHGHKVPKALIDKVKKLQEEASLDETLAISRKPLIGVIEVEWDGKVHRTCYPLPLEAKYLTTKTKVAFLDKVRLKTTERRMATMFLDTDIFVAEMEWVRVLSEKFWLYRLIDKNLGAFKSVMYALVVLLNMNVLMSPPEISKPFQNYFIDYGSLSTSQLNSLRITFVLGFINFFGYFIIMTTVAITTVPIMIRETDKRTERLMRKLEKSNYTDIMAFKWWFVTLVFNVMFILMHVTNFPQHRQQSTSMYSYLIFGINLPWTLSCVRNYIVVPSTRPQRIFVIVFDTLVTKPFFRNHLILQSFSIQGFLNTQYFTLMLFDIVNLSDRLANIVQALAFHLESLALVFYLFITTALTYASFGLQFFPEAFTTTYNGRTVEFKTVLSCFWFLFYNYSNRGNLKGALATADPKSSDWLSRLLFDTVFFIWVGIILFTTITALLVDALGKARVDQARKDSEVRNVCFVCGMHRADYDDLGLKPGSPSFDEHNKDHDPWIYVSYVAYLRKKPLSQYSGIESFVKEQIDKHGIWVPSKTSFAISTQAKMLQEEDEVEKEDSEFKMLLDKFSAVEQQMNDVVAMNKANKGKL